MLSPDGSTLLPGNSGVLSTEDGAWTFGTAMAGGGNVILLNGQQAARGAAVSLLVAQGGKLLAHSANGWWYEWIASWWRLSSDQTPGLLCASPDSQLRKAFPMDMHLAMVETTANNPYTAKIQVALTRAILQDGKLDHEILSIEGMSGMKYRTLINNLIEAIDDARYFEIGSWQGSTLCAAMYKNKMSALAIDNWSQFGGPANKFFENIARFKGPDAALSFLNEDFRAVNFSTIGKFNVYLFDGPHEEHDQRDGVVRVQAALDDQFVLIVDDWNWEKVRRGTFAGIRDAGLRLDFAAEIRTTLDNTQPGFVGAASDWHNGYFIAACSKVQS